MIFKQQLNKLRHANLNFSPAKTLVQLSTFNTELGVSHFLLYINESKNLRFYIFILSYNYSLSTYNHLDWLSCSDLGMEVVHATHTILMGHHDFHRIEIITARRIRTAFPKEQACSINHSSACLSNHVR